MDDLDRNERRAWTLAGAAELMAVTWVPFAMAPGAAVMRLTNASNGAFILAGMVSYIVVFAALGALARARGASTNLAGAVGCGLFYPLAMVVWMIPLALLLDGLRAPAVGGLLAVWLASIHACVTWWLWRRKDLRPMGHFDRRVYGLGGVLAAASTAGPILAAFLVGPSQAARRALATNLAGVLSIAGVAVVLLVQRRPSRRRDDAVPASLSADPALVRVELPLVARGRLRAAAVSLAAGLAAGAVVGWGVGALGPVLRRHLADFELARAALVVLVAAPALGLAWRWSRAESLVLGSDGVLFLRVRRPEWVPWSRVRGVTRDGDDLVLALDDGTTRALRPAPGARDALLARIATTMRGTAGADGAGMASLDRGGRPVAAWLDALRALATETADYRSAPLSSPALAAAVEDRDAPPDRRVGAAVVLALRGDATHRARLGALAAGLARPALREAFARLAAGDVDAAAIERALAEG